MYSCAELCSVVLYSVGCGVFYVMHGCRKVKINGPSGSRPASAVRQVGMALSRLKISLIAKLLPWLELGLP